MEITENQEIVFLVSIFLRAIMGRYEETENILLEVLTDNYTNEKMRTAISDSNEKLIKNIIAVLAGNGSVCEALNCMPGSEEQKMCNIVNKLWGEFFEMLT